MIAGLALRAGERQEFIEPAEPEPEYRDRNDAGVALLLSRALLGANLETAAADARLRNHPILHAVMSALHPATRGTVAAWPGICRDHRSDAKLTSMLGFRQVTVLWFGGGPLNRGDLGQP